jgi:hypothetical protein
VLPQVIQNSPELFRSSLLKKIPQTQNVGYLQFFAKHNLKFCKSLRGGSESCKFILIMVPHENFSNSIKINLNCKVVDHIDARDTLYIQQFALLSGGDVSIDIS